MACWVLLRGLVRESAHWDGFDVELREAVAPYKDKVTTVDFQGAGPYYHMTSPTDIAKIVDFTREQVRRQGYGKGPLILFSVSLGGMISIEWAQRFPNEVAGLVVANSSTKWSGVHERMRLRNWPRGLKLAMAKDLESREAEILRMVSNNTEAQAKILKNWVDTARRHPVSTETLIRQLVAASQFEPPKRPPTMPTLLMASTKDRLVSVNCSRRLAEVWGLPLLEHPWAGHDITLDDRGWVLDRLKEWREESISDS